MNIRSETDQSLFESFRKTRSEKDFRVLYRKHTPILYRIVFRFLDGNREHAEEVIQEAWVRAVENIERFRSKSSLRTWLTGIAINCCREFRQKKSKYAKPTKESFTTGLEERIHNKIDLEMVIGQLADGYKKVLILHDIEGFTHQEIAVLLNISEGTSKSQLLRGRAKVRKYLTSNKNSEINNDAQSRNA